ncbi:hypothetical protein ACXJJ3_12005 [Kribbella sp. WER1]
MEVEVIATVCRIGWVGFCGVAGLAGVVGAADWPLSVLILLFAVAGATGGMIALVVLNPDETTRRPREVWTIVAKCTVLSGAGTIVLAGLGSLAGAWTAVLIALLAVVGAPAVVPHWIGWFGQQPVVRTPRPVRRPARKVQASEDLADLSDEALCLAWRASFPGLQRAGSAAEQLRVVEERRAYLDELDRRHPDRVAAWLASNPRAAGDPAKFVRNANDHGGPTIDWNGLLQ